MIRVAGVHGVGNWYPELDAAAAADQLSSAWTAALATSVGTVPFELKVAYYADQLNDDEAVTQGDDPTHLPPDALVMLNAWLAQLGVEQDNQQGSATLPLRQTLHWIASRFGLDSRLVNWFIAQFFGEVAAYLRNPDSPARTGARRRVTDLIAAHRPDVLIAHSLGSVVTYEALCQEPTVMIDLLVTVGSPLGMPNVVVDRLQTGADGWLPRPPGVRRWINIADVGDIIAIPRRLGGRFDVDVDHETSIGLFDFHRARRYLSSPLVGVAIGATRDGVR